MSISAFCESVVYPVPPSFKNGVLAWEEIRRYLDYLYQHGARVVMMTAGTSRFNFLDEQEWFRFAVALADFPGAVIIGTPPLWDRPLAERIEQLNSIRHKHMAIMPVYPDRFYEEDSIVNYFHRAADLSKHPTMFHGMFMRNAVAGGMWDYTPEVVAKIKEHPDIIGMKEESTSLMTAYGVCQQADGDFLVIPAGGSCKRYSMLRRAGAQTFLGGIGNLWPEVEETFFRLIKAEDQETGRFNAAEHVIREYEAPFFKVAMRVGWHKALQFSLQYLGLMTSENRRPFSEISYDDGIALGAVIESVKAKLGELESL